MKNADWNNLRSRLHHDWLQRYFVFLNARSEQLDDMVKGNEEWRDDVKEQFIEWQEKSKMFKTLIDECEEALSPHQLLYEPPLDSMSQEDKDWLGKVIHALYLERTHIKESVASLKLLLAETDAAFTAIMQGGSDKPSPVVYFMDTLTKFSAAISKLPHTIQVV